MEKQLRESTRNWFNAVQFVYIYTVFLPVTWGIYFLLNSNRKYKAAQVCLISGIWHGANWTFIV